MKIMFLEDIPIGNKMEINYCFELETCDVPFSAGKEEKK